MILNRYYNPHSDEFTITIADVFKRYPLSGKIQKKIYPVLFRPENDADTFVKILKTISKAYPENGSAMSVLGNFYINWAWDARGNGWASSVTQDGWRKFHRRLETGFQLLKDNCEKYADDVRVWNITAFLAIASQSGADAQICYRNAMIRDPENNTLAQTRFHFLQPRWGGSITEGEKAAEWTSNNAPDDTSMKFIAILMYDRLWADSKSQIKTPERKKRIHALCMKIASTPTPVPNEMLVVSFNMAYRLDIKDAQRALAIRLYRTYQKDSPLLTQWKYTHNIYGACIFRTDPNMTDAGREAYNFVFENKSVPSDPETLLNSLNKIDINKLHEGARWTYRTCQSVLDLWIKYQSGRIVDFPLSDDLAGLETSIGGIWDVKNHILTGHDHSGKGTIIFLPLNSFRNFKMMFQVRVPSNFGFASAVFFNNQSHLDRQATLCYSGDRIQFEKDANPILGSEAPFPEINGDEWYNVSYTHVAGVDLLQVNKTITTRLYSGDTEEHGLVGFGCFFYWRPYIAEFRNMKIRKLDPVKDRLETPGMLYAYGYQWLNLQSEWALADDYSMIGGSSGNSYLTCLKPHSDNFRITAKITALKGPEISMWLCGSTDGKDKDGYFVSFKKNSLTIQKMQRTLEKINGDFVVPNKEYEMSIEYHAGKMSIFLNKILVKQFDDPNPLIGDAHHAFGFYVWDGIVRVRDVSLKDLSAKRSPDSSKEDEDAGDETRYFNWMRNK